MLHGGNIFQEVVGGGTTEDDDDDGHRTIATTTTSMIIPEYIDEAVGGPRARHSLRPEDAVGLYNMRLVSLMSLLFFLSSCPFRGGGGEVSGRAVWSAARGA